MTVSLVKETDELVEFDSLDLRHEWQTRSVPDIDGFLDHLRERVSDPDRVDDVELCDGCNDLHDTYFESVSSVKSGERMCEDCLDNGYSWCEKCEEYENDNHATAVPGGGRVCDDCLSKFYVQCERCEEYEDRYNAYGVGYDGLACTYCYENCTSYCEDCDESYWYDDADDHNHSGCECEAPAQTFRVRNNGGGMLSNDTRAKVSLPSGVISDEGIGAIALVIRNHGASESRAATDLDEWGNPSQEVRERYQEWCKLARTLQDALGSEWQTKQGNYTKRLSRHAYKTYGLKVPPEVISEVGNIGRAHSRGVNFEIEVTRNLNLPAEDFYHEDSCWWQSYSSSRCALKSNGGFGLRTFATRKSRYLGEYESVEGRAWVMPLRKNGSGLVPTFETEEPDAFVVFNGYGDLEEYVPARIVAHMAGMTYRKIAFWGEPMYVNNDSGYLVAPEEIAETYTDGRLRLSLAQHANLYEQEQAGDAPQPEPVAAAAVATAAAPQWQDVGYTQDVGGGTVRTELLADWERELLELDGEPQVGDRVRITSASGWTELDCQTRVGVLVERSQGWDDGRYAAADVPALGGPHPYAVEVTLSGSPYTFIARSVEVLERAPQPVG